MLTGCVCKWFPTHDDRSKVLDTNTLNGSCHGPCIPSYRLQKGPNNVLCKLKNYNKHDWIFFISRYRKSLHDKSAGRSVRVGGVACRWVVVVASEKMLYKHVKVHTRRCATKARENSRARRLVPSPLCCFRKQRRRRRRRRQWATRKPRGRPSYLTVTC